MPQQPSLPLWSKIAIGATLLAAASIFVFDRIVNEVTPQEIANRSRDNSPDARHKAEMSSLYHQSFASCMRGKNSIPTGMTEERFCEMYAGTQVLCKQNRQRGDFCE